MEAMINRARQQAGPCGSHAYEEDEERMKVIGQNGNTGEHYDKPMRMYPGDIEVNPNDL